jgi:hypothetical protein
VDATTYALFVHFLCTFSISCGFGVFQWDWLTPQFTPNAKHAPLESSRDKKVMSLEGEVQDSREPMSRFQISFLTGNIPIERGMRSSRVEPVSRF